MCSDLRSIGVSVRGVILSLVVVLLCIVGRQGQAVDANAGAVGPVLDPAQQAWLAAYGPVTFGVVEAGWPPYDSVTADGSWEGMSADYVAAIARAVGYEPSRHTSARSRAAPIARPAKSGVAEAKSRRVQAKFRRRSKISPAEQRRECKTAKIF